MVRIGMKRRWLPVVAVLGILAGCGGGGSSAGKAPATTTTTRPTVEADKARATRALLTAADLPGYTVGTPDNSPDPSDAAFKACLGNDPLLTRDDTSDPRHAVGPELDKEPAFLTSEAVVAESEDQARAAMVRLRSPELPGCLSKAFDEMHDPTVGFRNTTVKPLNPMPVGDDVTGLRISTQATSEGTSLKFTLDLEAVRRDRALAQLFVSGTGESFPDTERAALAQKMADRLAP